MDPPMFFPPGNMTGTLPIVNEAQRSLIIAPTVFLALATIAVGLRIYARRLKKAAILADDYFCILALILAYAQHVTILTLVVGGGMGLHFSLLSLSTQDILFKSIMANYILWCANVAALQLSILFMYTRVFGISRIFRKICYGCMALTIGWVVSGILLRMLVCAGSVNKDIFFMKSIIEGQCTDKSLTQNCEAVGLVHVILDFWILSLPIPLIWKLQMKKRTKAMLTVLLTIGVFASICSILRLECMITVFHSNPIDPTGTIWQSILFQSMEAPVGIICICFPTFPVIGSKILETRIGTMFKSLLTGSRTSSSGSSSNKAGESKENSDRSRSFQRITEEDRSKLSQDSQLPLQEGTEMKQNGSTVRVVSEFEVRSETVSA